MRSPLIDLHCHSTASDGTLAPADLVNRAAVAGVGTLALTDHDSLDGLDEAVRTAAGLGISLIPGVEISVTWRSSTVHVLGLGVDPANDRLRAGLTGLTDFRDWRAGEIARRLERSGIPGALEGAQRFRTGRILSRTHFARFLVERRLAGSVGDVFKAYLKPGKPGHVPGQWADLETAVEWVRGAGGIAVIAHPARYRLTRSKLRQLITQFKEAGGQGMEVVSGSHSRDDTLHMAAVSREHGMLASQGSDYHGPENPWIELGRLRPLPDGCTPVWNAEGARGWTNSA